MYKKLNITENHMKILALFTCGFSKELYVREVSRLAKLSPRAGQLILEALESSAVLESTTRGKIKLYKLRKTELAKEYLIIVEHYKKIEFIKKNLVIAEVISKISPYIDRTGLLFGSYAKGNQKEDSDLDVFVIGKCNVSEIEKIGNIYKIDVSVKYCSPQAFKKIRNNDELCIEILNNHITMLDAEGFISMVMDNGQY